MVCSADTGVQEVTDLPAGVRVFEVPVRHRRRPAIRYPFEYTAFFFAALGMVSWLALRRRYDVVQVDNLPDHLALVTPVARWRGARVVFNMFELMPEMVAARYPKGGLRGLVWVARAIEVEIGNGPWQRVHAEMRHFAAGQRVAHGRLELRPMHVVGLHGPHAAAVRFLRCQ